MMKKTARSLPVLMHHYINNGTNSIAVSPAIFEEHCRAMAQAGWRGVSLAEAEAFCIDGEPLPAKSALITFDDGYLDNYCYAMPLLHKYGHCGVMFAVTNRVEEGELPRYTIQDALAGNVPDLPELHEPVRPDETGLPTRQDVFCNRAEVRLMDEAGVLAVSGHSRTHYGIYTGEAFDGFMQPCRQGRTFYLTPEGQVWGMPRFSIQAGLSGRAFLPSPELTNAIRSFVPQNKKDALEFFADARNTEGLAELVRSFAGAMGRMETDAEMRSRMEADIALGKQELEAIVGHPLRTLCWPWGKCSPLAVHIAREAGYELLITTKEGPNVPGEPLSVCRFKVKSKPASWLLTRLNMYSRPLLGRLYSAIRL